MCFHLPVCVFTVCCISQKPPQESITFYFSRILSPFSEVKLQNARKKKKNSATVVSIVLTSFLSFVFDKMWVVFDLWLWLWSTVIKQNVW